MIRRAGSQTAPNDYFSRPMGANAALNPALSPLHGRGGGVHSHGELDHYRLISRQDGKLHAEVSFRFRWNFSQRHLRRGESTFFKTNSRDLQMKSAVNVNVTVANLQSIAFLVYLTCAPPSPLFAPKPGLKLHQPVNCEKSEHSPVKAWDIIFSGMVYVGWGGWTSDSLVALL